MKSIEYQCLDFWRSKPADETYHYSIHECALTQFVQALGGNAADTFWTDGAGNRVKYTVQMMDAALDMNGAPGPSGFTFGAAADRLEKLLQP